LSLVKDKVLLTFSLTKDEIEVLNEHFNKEGAKSCVIIENSMANYTLKEILEGKEKEHTKEELPVEKAIIFNNFEGEKLHKAVTEVRALLQSRPILATITPISINMKFKDVLEHLVEEREFHKKNSKK